MYYSHSKNYKITDIVLSQIIYGMHTGERNDVYWLTVLKIWARLAFVYFFVQKSERYGIVYRGEED